MIFCFVQIPNCVGKADEAASCYHLGYMLDGFPVYGKCEHTDGSELVSCYKLNDGEEGSNFDQYTFDSTNCHLDEANGYTFSDGSYGYILTENFSTTPTGYYGPAQSTPCGFTPV